MLETVVIEPYKSILGVAPIAQKLKTHTPEVHVKSLGRFCASQPVIFSLFEFCIEYMMLQAQMQHEYVDKLKCGKLTCVTKLGLDDRVFW